MVPLSRSAGRDVLYKCRDTQLICLRDSCGRRNIFLYKTDSGTSGADSDMALQRQTGSSQQAFQVVLLLVLSSAYAAHRAQQIYFYMII